MHGFGIFGFVVETGHQRMQTIKAVSHSNDRVEIVIVGIVKCNKHFVLKILVRRMRG